MKKPIRLLSAGLTPLVIILLAACSPIKPESTPDPPSSPPDSASSPLRIPSGNGGGVIAFASDRIGGRMDLYLINGDGSELTQITTTSDDELAPSWSPDGSKLAYISAAPGGLMLMVIDFEELLLDPDNALASSPTTRAVAEASPTWTADNNFLLYSSPEKGQNDLFLTSLDGKTDLRVTATEFNEIHPAVSPDGSKLVYCSDEKGDFDLFLIENFDPNNLDFSSPLQISSLDGNELFPAWSPDGNRLVYTSSAAGNKDLIISTWKGENPLLVAASEADEWKASWNPEGNQLVYSYFNFNAELNDLKILTIETLATFPVTADQFDNWWPDWKP